MSNSSSSGLEGGLYSAAKRPRILSSIGSTQSSSHDQADDSSYHSHDADGRDSIADVYKKPEVVQRNKRLFGALMGHLGVAKRNLEEDSSIGRQSARQMAVSQKNGLENRRLQQLQREASDSFKAKEKALREIFKLRQRKSDISSSSATWKEKFMAPRMHVLMTQTLPALCWLPTAHTLITQSMLDKRTCEVAAEVSEHDRSDSVLIKQIDKELSSLQTYVSTFVDEPRAVSIEGDIGEDGEVQGLSAKAAAIAGMTSSELSEYMTRVHSRRVHVEGSQSMEGCDDVDSVANRHNWGLDQGHGPFDDMRQAANQPVSYVSSGKRGMENATQEASRSHERHQQQNGRSFEGRQHDSSHSSNSEGNRHRGSAGEEDGGEMWGADNSRRGGYTTRRSGDISRNNDSVKVPEVLDEEYNPDEAVDEGQVADEEDEAELLLAALGGRKH